MDGWRKNGKVLIISFVVLTPTYLLRGVRITLSGESSYFEANPKCLCNPIREISLSSFHCLFIVEVEVLWTSPGGGFRENRVYTRLRNRSCRVLLGTP